jgi:hypothetical protein
MTLKEVESFKERPMLRDSPLLSHWQSVIPVPTLMMTVLHLLWSGSYSALFFLL